MFSQELPDGPVEFHPPPTMAQPMHGYVVEILKRLKEVHMSLREEQLAIGQEDREKPPLYAPGN